MKIILRIARTELATLFYSPIAWFILIVFSVLTAKLFVGDIGSAITSIGLSAEENYQQSLSYSIFLNPMGGLWSNIVGSLYIYIPLLTMGLISRETASGSIKLLYSSPVTSGQIVLGKYLAAITFGLSLLAIPFFALLFSGCYIPHFDWTPVLVGFCGLYLLICAYCAVGLYFSSLTNYQVVAAIGTLTVLAAMRFIGEVGQSYDFVRELTYWLSINSRTSDMLQGILRSEDLVYFAAIIVLFLTFTTFRIAFSRRTISKLRQAGCYLGVFAGVMTIGYLTSRPWSVKVWDTTATERNSITEASREVLSKMNGEVTITNYVNLLDNNSHSYLPYAMKSNESLFDAYCRFKPDLHVKYVYYYDKANGIGNNPKFADMSIEELRDYLAMVYNLNPRRFKSPEQIREIEDLSGEQNTFVRVVEMADGNRTYIRDFNDMQRAPSEAEITAAFKKMIVTPPVVGVISGHGERAIDRSGDRDYSAFTLEKYSRAALVNQGFDIRPISLVSDTHIAPEINIVILADPKESLSDAESEVLKQYIARGGNLMILTDTEHQSFINPLLQPFGIQAEAGILAQSSEDFYPDLILAQTTPESVQVESGFGDLGKYQKRITMPGCVALTQIPSDSGFASTPLLQTQEKGSWIELEHTDLRESEIACNPAAGEKDSTYTAAYALRRNVGEKEQRILVLGDADCMSNAELMIQRDGVRSGNFELIVRCFHWLSGGEFPIIEQRPDEVDCQTSLTTESIDTIQLLFLFILPALMLITAVGLWLLRRRN